MKQVIVIRKDLNMRKGKMIAQGCHASLGAYLQSNVLDITDWNEMGARKIVLGCNSEEELLKLENEISINLSHVPLYLVTDSGLTEFHGEPTKTALGIGPVNDDVINPYTDKLVLL